MRQLLRNLSDGGTTVLVSSHLLSEIQAACDRIVMIQRGQMVFTGTIDELLGSRQDRIIAVPEHDTDLAALVQVAAVAGYEVSEVGGAARILAPLEWAANLNRQATLAGITLRELRPDAVDLEEAFLELTNSGEGGES